MNQHRLVTTASLLFALLTIAPAFAGAQVPGSVPTGMPDRQRVDDAQQKERLEKQRKEEEARLEADKRKQAEEKKRHDEAEKRAKEENARKEQERKDHEKKDLERREQAQKEEARKREEDKRREDERRADESRRKEEERKRREEDRRIEENKRKEQEAKREQDRRKDEEIRLEIEKRREVEREEARRRERERERERHDNQYPSYPPNSYPYNNGTSHETVVIISPPAAMQTETGSTPTPVVIVPTPTTPAPTPTVTPSEPAVAQAQPVPEESYRYYHRPEPAKSYVGVVFAPGSGDRKPAVGLQYLSSRNIGVGLWLSGSLGEDDDVIDATIPHNDYYTDTRTGTYGLQGLCCVGSDAATVIFGAGLSIAQTTYTDISNATGWKWNGGESYDVKPSALIGCRFRVGGRISLQLGYDSIQSGFFGLSASF